MFLNNSCRFCLDIVSEESELVVSLNKSKILTLIEKKLINLHTVLDVLELSTANSNASHLPHLICNECRTTIIKFYSLKKTFQENLLILCEKSSSQESQDPELKNFTTEDLPKT